MQIGQREFYCGEIYRDTSAPQQAFVGGVSNAIEFRTVVRDDLGFVDLEADPSLILIPPGIGWIMWNYAAETTFVGQAYSFNLGMIRTVGGVSRAGNAPFAKSDTSINPQGFGCTGLIRTAPGEEWRYKITPTQNCFSSDYLWLSWLAFPE
jgi:hypothetical protein